jgi:hypothetical protein
MTRQAFTPEGVANEIERILTEVVAIQKPYVVKICPSCPDPCCGKVQHLFDERDLIFARVLCRPEITRRRSRRQRGCAFLLADGCGVPPLSRPFICHRYLCPTLKESISSQTPRLLDELIEKLSVLEHLRSKLFECYLSYPRTIILE